MEWTRKMYRVCLHRSMLILLLAVCWTIACGTVHGQTITLLQNFSQNFLESVSSVVLDGTDIYVTGAEIQPGPGRGRGG